MLELVLGIAAAFAASTFYSLGIALQAMDAREAPHDEHLRLALAWDLMRRARWLAGTALSIVGFPLQLLLVLSERMLGERAGRYEYIAVCAIVIGVVGAALTAPARSSSDTSEQL